MEIEGGTDYEGGVRFDDPGTEAMPIIVRGVGSARPRISGGVNTIEAAGNHYVFENLDLSGGSSRCFFHHAHDITLRDSVVHDCPRQGILGADNDSGSMLLERVEVYRCGGGDRDHQIYMATDEVAYPGSVFRMQFCWIHDANGGNNVKSRAERNEIYSNWIEGAYYHELELIGPDPSGGVPEDQAREDSDVVGNVFIKRGDNEAFPVVRFGGDGTGQTHGRYRFAFNTVIVAPGSSSAIFRLFHGLESVEMHSNVFAMRGGGPVNMLREVEAEWTSGRAIAGTNNWVPTGSMNVPDEWTGTVTGDAPGLREIDDLDALDLYPASEASPVVDTGLSPPPTFAAHPFDRPNDRPAYSPIHGVGRVDRPVVGVIDRGAYEHGSGPPPTDGGPHDVDAGTPDAGSRTDAGTILTDASSDVDGGITAPVGGGCGCASAPSPSGFPLALAGAALALLLRRRG